jgi:hypothetical protein
MSEIKKIYLSKLTQQVNEGMKLKPLAEYYGLPVAQMKKILNEAGLKIRKFRNPSYELVIDIGEEESVEESEEEEKFFEEEEEFLESFNNLIN